MNRTHLAQAAGPGKHGRVLEVAAGNGSNTPMLAARALRLTVTEGTPSGAELTRQAIEGIERTSVHQLDLADRFPGDRYDLIVISEVLYYLPDRSFRALASEVSRTLRPAGTLVLAHHTVFFDDALRDGRGVHRQFLGEVAADLACAFRRRTRRYVIERLRRTR
ncbi:MAG: class I SAM-dependent methyltransferase [Henriciella sp.]|uniref:class I SAM-dependent methyltransferase n=1 Tax=Henriciella sp. TaxID=1968823 RepID=UPI003C725815